VQECRLFMAMTIDITDEYCYGTNKGYLLQEDYGLQWEAVIESIMFFGNLLRLFPLVQILILHAPTWALRYMDPRIETLRHYQGELQRRAEDLLAKQGQHSQTGRKEVQTIFHALVESDLPPEELTIQRLVDEGKTILAAGSETVPAALSQTVYFLLEDKRRLRRVMAELDSVMPPGTATASLQQLEKLPYLVSEDWKRLSAKIFTIRSLDASTKVFALCMAPLVAPHGSVQMRLSDIKIGSFHLAYVQI